MEEYKISNYEYCKNVENLGSIYPRTMKLYIPKYMPNIKSGNWRQKVAIAGNLFVNAPECSIKTPTTVMEQGYYTASVYANENPNFSNKFNYDLGYIPAGKTFLAEIMYEDPHTLKITGKV